MERCKFCGGPLEEDKVSVNTRWRDRNIEVRNISALVCSSCGETYVREEMAEGLNSLQRPMEREEFLKNPDKYMDADEYFPGKEDYL